MTTNEDIVKELYAVAEADSPDVDRFASLFHEDGYFLDESSGQRWVGDDVRQPVKALNATFPDMHRELLRLHATDDVVVVELKLQGTHKGDFTTPFGVFPATGERYDVPCCDVWRLSDGKVKSFHCYKDLSDWLQQLGVFDRTTIAAK